MITFDNEAESGHNKGGKAPGTREWVELCPPQQLVLKLYLHTYDTII